MTSRGLSKIATCVLLLASFAGCIDIVQLPDPTGKSPDSGTPGDSGPKDDGGKGGTDGGRCIPGPEICNGIDDDCDGDDDSQDPDTQAHCEGIVLNSITFCGQVMESWVCIPGQCLEGFAKCDGEPSNGCEPECMCMECPDSGSDDGGADDAGH